MKPLFRLCVCLLLALSVPACAGLASALSVVSTAIADTNSALDLIDSTVAAYQLAHPFSTEDRSTYQTLLAHAYEALHRGSAVVAGANALNQGDVDQAFADFKQQYQDLTAWLKQKGITPKSVGMVGAGKDGEGFPEPLVIGVKIR